MVESTAYSTNAHGFSLPLSKDEQGNKIEVTVEENTFLRAKNVFEQWANHQWPDSGKQSESLRGVEVNNMVLDGLLRSGALGTSIEDSFWQRKMLRTQERATSSLVDALRDEFCPEDAKAIRQARPGQVVDFHSEAKRRESTACFERDPFP